MSVPPSVTESAAYHLAFISVTHLFFNNGSTWTSS